MLSSVFLIELMENKRYGVEYQPIVNVNDQEIFAFECLARFCDRKGKFIPPNIVFDALHKSPLSLFQVEYEQKRLQLMSAPDSARIFINLDQDSFFAYGHEGEGIENPFLSLFKQYPHKGRNDMVVELIENSELIDARRSQAMIDILSKNGIRTAIDDVFNPESVISTAVLQRVDYIKLDKNVLENRFNEDFIWLVKAIINYAHISGKKVILEGVENHEDLFFAERLQVDFVQGYLFREMFLKRMPD